MWEIFLNLAGIPSKTALLGSGLLSAISGKFTLICSLCELVLWGSIGSNVQRATQPRNSNIGQVHDLYWNCTTWIWEPSKTATCYILKFRLDTGTIPTPPQCQWGLWSENIFHYDVSLITFPSRRRYSN